MCVIEKFIPKTLNTLSIEEKKDAINELITNLCKKLKIEPIDVVFSNLKNDDGELTIGKFIHHPLCIIINESFINNEKEISYLKKKNIDYDVAVSYYLVHAIAHECYHYFQFNLEKKLIDNIELTDKEKESAYLYFICLYDNLFSSFNIKNEFYDQCDISDEDIYLYSPIELSANSFANEIVSNLGKVDEKENFKQYDNDNLITYFSLTYRNIQNGGNLIQKSINHSLINAINFLNHKNKTSGLSTKYLGIDVEELETYVNKSIKKWKDTEKKQIEFYNTFIKKR